MNWIKKQWAKIGPVAKAVAAGAGAAVTYLIGMGSIDLSLNPIDVVVDTWSNLAAYSTLEWFLLVAAVGTVYGFTWAVPNRPT